MRNESQFLTLSNSSANTFTKTKIVSIWYGINPHRLLVSDRMRCTPGQNMLLKQRILATHIDGIRRSRPRDRKNGAQKLRLMLSGLQINVLRRIDTNALSLPKAAISGRQQVGSGGLIVHAQAGMQLRVAVERLHRCRREASKLSCKPYIKTLGVTNFLTDCTPTRIHFYMISDTWACWI